MTDHDPTADPSTTTAVVDRQLTTLGAAVRASAASHRGDLAALQRRRHVQRRRRASVVAAVVVTVVVVTAAAAIMLGRRAPAATSVLTAPPGLAGASTAVPTPSPAPSTSLSSSPSSSPSTSPAVPASGDCTTTGGFTTHTVANPTVVGDFKFVLVGEEHFLRWAAGESRCHREAEVQPLEPDRPLVGLLSAHHRDSTRPLSFPVGMDALLFDAAPTDYVLGTSVQQQRTPTDGPDEHRCAVEQSYVRTDLPGQTRWVCLVEADFGVVTIDGPDRDRIEAFVAVADLRSLLGG
jgi:hypothetical protein